MPTIHLTTFIAAPVDVVFDLSRHISVHKESMSKFGEEAVAGTRFGLMEKDETVTWKAKHFFKTRLPSRPQDYLSNLIDFPGQQRLPAPFLLQVQSASGSW